MRFVVLKRAQKNLALFIILNIQENEIPMWPYKQESMKNEGIFGEWMTNRKLKNIKKFWQLSDNEWHLAFFDTNECSPI